MSARPSLAAGLAVTFPYSYSNDNDILPLPRATSLFFFFPGSCQRRTIAAWMRRCSEPLLCAPSLPPRRGLQADTELLEADFAVPVQVEGSNDPRHLEVLGTEPT